VRPRTDSTRENHLNVDSELKSILGEILGLDERAARLTDQTELLGSLPELDSMAVVSVITTIEERFGIAIGDDEISADTFATFGSLRRFVEDKVNG
jgi:acyl carrier protein